MRQSPHRNRPALFQSDNCHPRGCERGPCGAEGWGEWAGGYGGRRLAIGGKPCGGRGVLATGRWEGGAGIHAPSTAVCWPMSLHGLSCDCHVKHRACTGLQGCAVVGCECLQKWKLRETPQGGGGGVPLQGGKGRWCRLPPASRCWHTCGRAGALCPVSAAWPPAPAAMRQPCHLPPHCPGRHVGASRCRPASVPRRQVGTTSLPRRASQGGTHKWAGRAAERQRRARFGAAGPRRNESKKREQTTRASAASLPPVKASESGPLPATAPACQAASSAGCRPQAGAPRRGCGGAQARRSAPSRGPLTEERPPVYELL